ncbi:MAG: thiolase family protein [Desulfatiglans sp.]|jgi:acetyl-CoA C-acetyltransferase|nr:thiolase family protein [Desulfatiglans sp.]
MNDRDVVIVSAVRTPFGKFDGVMKEIPSIDLAVTVLKELVERIQLDPSEVDELYYGTCVPAEYAPYLNVPARQITLLAGFPPENISITLDRACCSSMSALRLGYRAIRSGEADTVIACGAENMANSCFLVEPKYLRWGNRLGPVPMEDVLFELGYGRKGFNAVSVDAGEVALEYDVTREEQDRWGLLSQMRWAQAYEDGKFKVGEELMAIDIPQKRGGTIRLEKDESPRETSLEKLSKLKTVYGSPTVTAGNAPGLNAGAAAIAIMSRKRADEKGLPILGEILSTSAAATEPRSIATVPAKSITMALEKAGSDLEDLDLIEINEAFAAMPLVSLKILANNDNQKWKDLQDICNVNGGAIAIGHPVGASGARIVMTLMYELIRKGGGQGVSAICGGLAQGEAIVVRV